MTIMAMPEGTTGCDGANGVGNAHDLGVIIQREERLRQQAIQRVSVGYEVAMSREAKEPRQWVGDYPTVGGEPLTAFRLDSRDTYLLNNNRNAHQRLVVYVPADTEPGQEVSHYRARKTEPNNGRVILYFVDPEFGFRYIESSSEDPSALDELDRSEEIPEGETFQGLNTIEDLVREQNIDSRQTALDALRAHVRDLREDFVLVKFSPGLDS